MLGEIKQRKHFDVIVKIPAYSPLKLEKGKESSNFRGKKKVFAEFEKNSGKRRLKKEL